MASLSDPGYAELQVTSNFSFLRGAAHPHELVATAAALGHRAIAITDHNSLAGIVRAHRAAKEIGLRLVVGCRLDLDDGASLLAFPVDRAAYGRLTRLLTLGKRRAPKGDCRLGYADVVAHGLGQIVVVLPPHLPPGGRPSGWQDFAAFAGRVAADFAGRAYLAAHHLYRGDDARHLARLAALAETLGLPLVATNDVLYHVPQRRPLQDVLTCIRYGCTIGEAGFCLAANAERHLKSPQEMARLFRGHEDAVHRSLDIADRCRFSLDELCHEYPDETVGDGRGAQQRLADLAWAGAEERFGPDVPQKVRALVAHELRLIGELDYARYFLTVYDIVAFARRRGILCQGRGSAANSAVCYCLGITAVDPARIDVLFERFISAARNEPPDIDVDFEHERREEVIQYIYEKYGRERAGLAATVISYRSRSAIREVGKALGLSVDVVAALAGIVWGWSNEPLADERVREAGLDPKDPVLRRVLDLAAELVGFPRHLSQHVGGFVITRGPLSELVPIENAAMADRTVIEWDKDDLDALGILKIDVLALGMLTCIRKALALIAAHNGRRLELAAVPAEDERVYDMLCRADSIGVFQVESRAQMTMLPRLKPREFYDLVIEVAIVRPGPIQGDMVHPYLRRRSGREPVEFPSEALRRVLGKTLGVPLFQEQAMKIAIVGAGFPPEEADRLRRAMATFRHNGDIHRFRDRFVAGMAANGYDHDFAVRCFSQIEGFGTYGFPESHAASFALLVYVSAWIKCFYPAAFACALLNSQPMGFYAPAQIVGDARGHGVEVRPIDVNHSLWDCTLEPVEQTLPHDGGGLGGGDPCCRHTVRTITPTLSRPHRGGGNALTIREDRGPGGEEGESGGWALRLGFRLVKGLAETDAEKLIAARDAGYGDAPALWRRSGLGRAVLERLAEADALRSLGLDRRRALWALKPFGAPPLPLFAAGPSTRREPSSSGEIRAAALLPEMPLGEHVVEDFASTGLTLKRHPLAFLRANLARAGRTPASGLAHLPDGSRVAIAGIVLIRQRPGSAKGVVFITIEDETGIANLILWPPVLDRFRRAALGATLLDCAGKLQREESVIHIVAERLADLTPRLHALRDLTGDDRPPPARPLVAAAGGSAGHRVRDILVPARNFR